MKLSSYLQPFQPRLSRAGLEVKEDFPINDQLKDTVSEGKLQVEWIRPAQVNRII